MLIIDFLDISSDLDSTSKSETSKQNSQLSNNQKELFLCSPDSANKQDTNLNSISNLGSNLNSEIDSKLISESVSELVSNSSSILNSKVNRQKLIDLNNSSIKKTLYTENDIIKQTLQSRNSNNKKTIFKRKKEIFNEFLADMRKIKKPPKFQLKYKSEQENEFIDYFHTNSPPKYKIERTNIVEYKINK